MCKSVLIAATLALTVSFVLPAAADELKGVWVTTSGSVDTSTPEAIVGGLVKPGMADEQKVLAIFNWYRRVIYPHNYLADDRRDVLRQINSYGCTLCGSHAANLGWLMRAAGFKTRCTFINNGGHTFIEVWFDNGWHAVDPETDFAVWSRAAGPNEKPHLINMEELKADPTLLDKAIEEGRAKPWFYKAMRHLFATRKAMADYCDRTKENKDSMTWSSCVLKDGTIKDYFVEGVKTLKYSAENDAYGGRVSDPDLMKLALRPGERLVRCWDNEGRGKFIAGQGFAGYPAHFMAKGEADEEDAEVFPFVEPYLKRDYGIPGLTVAKCYRYSGNGHLVWSAKNGAELAATPGVTLDGITVDKETGLVRSAAADKAGTITIPFRSSYALVDCCVRVKWAGEADKAGRVSVVSAREPKDIPPATQPEGAKAVAGQSEYVIGKEINGRFNYLLQITLPAADDAKSGGLAEVSFDHTFVNNWLVLPFLTPGKNTVRVRLDNPDALKRTRLFVKYEWAEGADWKQDKSEEREVTGSPFEYELTVPGTKFPRMKAVTLRAENK